MSALFHITDEALDLEILKSLEGAFPMGLTEAAITRKVGELSGGEARVKARCQELQGRSLIFSVSNIFWKIAVSGRLAARKGVL